MRAISASVGADVGGGLLATDVLLPGGQGQDVAPGGLPIHRLPHQAARQVAHVLLAGRQEAQGGPPNSSRCPAPAPRPAPGPRRTRRATSAGPGRSARHHATSRAPPAACAASASGQVLDAAEEVGVLHHQAGGRGRSAALHRVQVGHTGLAGCDLAEDEADLRARRSGRLAVLRVERAAHHDLGPPRDPDAPSGWPRPSRTPLRTWRRCSPPSR